MTAIVDLDALEAQPAKHRRKAKRSAALTLCSRIIAAIVYRAVIVYPRANSLPAGRCSRLPWLCVLAVVLQHYPKMDKAHH